MLFVASAIAGRCGDADHSFQRPRFRRPRWRSASRVGDRADIEFVDIVDVDRQHLIGERCRRADVARTVMLRLAPSASRSIAAVRP